MRCVEGLPLPPPLAEAALKVARGAKAAGGKAWLVGGAVRDILSGGAPKDADIEVFGLSPASLRAMLEKSWTVDLVGASFGVFKLRGLDMDVALPRRESKTAPGHKGFQIEGEAGLDLATAAARRDFTVNAIYLDPLTGELADPWHGIDDLSGRILRHVTHHFAEDPLRVLRGMQFAARFRLDPAPETVALCRTMGPEGLPPERLFGEWEKLLLKGVSISRGLAFLRATGWVAHYPELAALIGCRQDPKWHPEGDVWDHTLLALDAFAAGRTGERYEDLVVGLAVLCHDFGKPATTVFSDGHLRSKGHDAAGVAPAVSFLKRLTNEERILRDVPPLVAQHMQPFSLWRANAGDAAIRRLALKVGRIDRLLRVARADDMGRTPERAGGSSLGEDLRWLARKAEELRIAAEAPKPLLMGRHLIEMGFKPSPRFGEWLEKCFNAQIDGAFHDLTGAKEYFRRLAD